MIRMETHCGTGESYLRKIGWSVLRVIANPQEKTNAEQRAKA